MTSALVSERARARAAGPGSPAASGAPWSPCCGAIVIFGVFMELKGANPIDAYRSMWDSTFTSTDSLEQILVKATPLILAALAVTVPARAGLVNVGGEGQLVIGGIGAAAVVMWFGNSHADGRRARAHGGVRRGRRRDLGRDRRRRCASR